MYSPETLSYIAHVRAKTEAGTVTEEEYKKAIELMREGRREALQAADSSKRKKAAAAIPSADSLLDGLI